MDHPDHRFPGSRRMKSKKEIGRLFEQGRTGFVHPVRYVFLDDGKNVGASPFSVLVSVPKRNHKRAVDRNLLKRRLREAFRQNCTPLAETPRKRLSLALLYASGSLADYGTIEQAVQKIVRILTETR